MRMTELAAALAVVDDDAWLRAAQAELGRDPDGLPRLFAAAPRRLGRAEAGGWTADAAGRAVLLATVLDAPGGPTRITDLYRYGDSGEKLAILRALPLLPDPGGLPVAAVPLLRDALRTNDKRLVAAALGPYARNLDQAAWRQGVLKCVFMGIPLSAVDLLEERADVELAVMLDGLAAERAAAGRALAADAVTLLRRLTTAAGGQSTAKEA
jgi:hypothetical protein